MTTIQATAKQDAAEMIAAYRKFADVTRCKEAADAANAKADALEKKQAR